MQERQERLNWTLFLAAYGLVVAFFVARGLYNVGGEPLFADNDDAMRLVVVRDFLAGQNWFDHTQYRMNTPFGAQMHWSRLVDLPIAALIIVIGPLAGAYTETIVAYLWPMIMLFALLLLSAQLTLRLVGREGILAAILLPCFSRADITEFSPGRLDHHSVQIILTAALVLWTIKARQRPGFAIWAGLAAATSIAIGTENLSAVAAAVLIFGLFYVLTPQRGPAVRNFGLALGLGTVAHLGLALPPGEWFAPACDAISIVYATAALASGLGLTLLSYFPLANRHWVARLIAGAILGSAVLVGLALLFPNCLAGPYGDVDPWLVTHWLNEIGEARPFIAALLDRPAYVISSATPVFLGMGLVVYLIWKKRGESQVEWLILGVFLAMALLVSLLQARGFRISAILAVPAGAYLIAAARNRYLKHGSALNAFGLAASWAAFAGIAIATVLSAVLNLVPTPSNAAMAEAVPPNRFDCLKPEVFADLAALPPERIMVPIDLGAYMLLYTHHSVVATPYHRNTRGLLDTYDFLNKPIEEARRIVDERGIGLVVTCPILPEMAGLPDAADTSFVRLAEKNQLPAWLHDVSLPGSPFKTYAVLPQ